MQENIKPQNETGLHKVLRSWKWAVLIVVVLFILCFPLLNMPSYSDLLAMMAFFAVGAVAFRIMVIMGRFSMGHTFFVALGAYTSGILAVKASVNPWLGLLAAAVIGLIVTYLLGIVVLRVPGMYFAILTLALTTLTVNILNMFPNLTGGSIGLNLIPGYSIGSYHFGMKVTPYYYMFMALLAFSIIFFYRLEKSPIGLVTHAVGTNDVLAQHMGTDPKKVRMQIFVASGAILSVAGALYAHYLHYISPENLGMMLSLYYQIWAIAGGLGSIWGPVVGVLFIESVNRFTGVALYTKPLIYGGVLVAVFMFLPRGLISVPDAAKMYYRSLASKFTSTGKA